MISHAGGEDLGMDRDAVSSEAVSTRPTNPPVKPLRGEARAVPLATRAMPRELTTYMAQFRRVFGRLETFENACSYVTGLLSDLPRKNGEKMAEAIEGIPNTEMVHRFMALSPWSAEELDRLRVHHAVACATSGDVEGALILDEVSQLKQGRLSVGVKRQYLGCEGKTANGQVSVTAHYSDGLFDWPVTGRLYLPEDWTKDAERRDKAGVPKEITFATKGEIALALVQRAQRWGVPFRWVLMDAGYDDLDMLATLADKGLCFCIGVKRNFMVRVPEEIERWVPPPQPPRRGRPRLRPDPRSMPSVYRVDELLAGLPESLWRPVTYRQGTAGPLTKDFAALRVQCATTTRMGPDVWLLFERSVAGGGPIKHYVLYADRELALDELAQVAHRRPLIERNSYENGKGEVGLRDYQGRSWIGFHHHLSLAMLALTWLNLQRQALPPRESPPTAPGATAGLATTVEVELPGRDQPLRFTVAQPAATDVSPPRQRWESVQEVRRRFVAWCASTVQAALARRGGPLPVPTFVPLCGP